MTRRSVPGVITTLVLALCLAPCWGQEAARLVIAGQTLKTDPPCRAVEGVLCGPVEPCAKAIGAQVSWSSDRKTLTLTPLYGSAVSLSVGSAIARIVDRAAPLPRPVEMRQGQCYAPLAAVLKALGCAVKWDPKANQATVSARLTASWVEANEVGARVYVRTSIPVKWKTGAVEAPPRSIVDFTGTALDTKSPLTRYIFTGPLMRVRLGTPKDDTSRIVADLAGPIGVRWAPASDGCGGTLHVGATGGAMVRVDRNLPKLTNVTTVQPVTGGEALQAKVDWGVAAKWDLFSKPPRVVLALPEVESRVAETQLPMFGEFVDRVEVRQMDPGPGTELVVYLRELIRFDVAALSGGGVQVRFRRESLSGKKVVVDAGHGGRDTGARGDKLLEKDINLDVAQRTSRLLCSYGALARLTRSTDQFVDLFARAELANAYDADLFVSVHCNAMPRRNQGHGTETFYCRQDSKCLGYLVQGCLVDALQRTDRGLKQARFVVIRETEMPAVLAELMFINDDREETLLAQNAVRDKAAGALAEGVRRYFEGSGSAPFVPERSAQVTGAG